MVHPGIFRFVIGARFGPVTVIIVSVFLVVLVLWIPVV